MSLESFPESLSEADPDCEPWEPVEVEVVDLVVDLVDVDMVVGAGVETCVVWATSEIALLVASAGAELTGWDEGFSAPFVAKVAAG